MGYIYLLEMADGVYKVGRTSQEIGPRIKRMSGYPGDSRLVMIRWSDQTETHERKIVICFNSLFGRHLRGLEYFVGDEAKMINIINSTIDGVNPTPVIVPTPIREETEEYFVQCPKCLKVFTHPLYISKAKEHLDRHLARKNPCDGSATEYVYERKRTGTVPSIENLDLTGLGEALDKNVQCRDVSGFVFKFLNDLNKFAVMPNVKVNEVFYVTDGVVTCVGLGEFVAEFWHKVMVTQVNPVLQARWPRFTEWRTGLSSPDVYKQMKSAIRGHLKSVTREERFRTRSNMGAGEAEQRRIAFQTVE